MKKYFTLFFVVLTLFLVACTPVQESVKEDVLSEARSQLTNEDCEIKETTFERENCYYQKAVIFEDASFCKKIEGIGTFGTKTMCIDALKNCENLATTEEKDSCYSEKRLSRHNAAIRFNLGVGYLITYCDKITDQLGREWCYLDTAVSWTEPNICEKVSKEPIGEGFGIISRDICYELVKARILVV